ncbi:hypothetical protein EYC84_001579 [Monilinia fructicola]|uniref:Major facilitator superfamily (MFS) profile domain-containing protein n=1 Tax=Monilinia fructicola TaxID=38448 RepID=A0A5M9JUX9_MONFR|nr:hypothetical protein EYC84_001579 [Monilinia fructicola]
MTLHTSNPPHHNDPVSETPSTIPVELQLWNDIDHEPSQAKGHPHVYAQSKDLESGNATDVELLPVDGGPAAWKLLIAAFIFEAILWGFPISFGVFQDYYFTLPRFSASKSKIALIGTISQGLCYLGAPLSASLTKRFPRYQTHQIWLGLPICILGLVAGSFCTSVQGLIWTQGVMAWPLASSRRRRASLGRRHALHHPVPALEVRLPDRAAHHRYRHHDPDGAAPAAAEGPAAPERAQRPRAHQLELPEAEALLDLWGEYPGLRHGLLLPGRLPAELCDERGLERDAGRGHLGRHERGAGGGPVCVRVSERQELFGQCACGWVCGHGDDFVAGAVGYDAGGDGEEGL